MELAQLLAAIAEGGANGAQLAERLGVSRTMIWKGMQTLRQEGLVIEGEALVTMDDGTVVELRPGTLATFPAGSSCVWDVTQALTKHYSFS